MAPSSDSISCGQNLPDDATTIILESISDGVFTVDADWRITSFNRAAEQITGVPRAEVIGRPCSDVFRASMCEGSCALRYTMDCGDPVINRSAFIIDAKGRRIPISISTALLRDKSGRVVGGVETFRDLSLVEALRNKLQKRFRMGDLVSCSPLVGKIFDILPQVAASGSSVLIQGDTGTGKEVLARAIHNQSHRADKPFVALNCSALPDSLLESELFGYKAGAFTGANHDKPGRFELARGGTILLDEIGDITPALQVRLLRVLQEKTFEPLGGTRTVKTDVRVIAATHRDLTREVQKGSFRQDLFYRINVVRLDLPPLNQRREDIPMLVEHFINRLNREQGKNIRAVSPETWSILTAHDYPGNIRELENIIEHAFVLCAGDQITIDHLPRDLTRGLTALKPRQMPGADLQTIVEAAEIQTIIEALRRHKYKRLAAAKELGIHKTTLFRKMKSLGISFERGSGGQ